MENNGEAVMRPDNRLKILLFVTLIIAIVVFSQIGLAKEKEVDKDKLDKLKEFSTSKEIPAGAIPKDIEEKIEELPVSSLLSKPEEEDKPTDSLLGRE